VSSIEAIFFWLSIGFYVAATVAIFAGTIWRREQWVRNSLILSAAGLVAQAGSIAVRWYEAGHFPYIKAYENVLVGAFVMVAAYVAIAYWRKSLAFIGVLVLPVVLLTLGYGYTQAEAAGPVTPPYQSFWLVVHVTFAWITYAAYSVVAGLAVALLMRQRAERKGTEKTGVPSWVPPSDQIDELSLKLVAFGFLNNAVMIASGAIWAYRLWGSYWSWDPVETWSLLTWLAYGFYLHARLTLGWKGARLAWVALFALFGVLMTFWGVQLAPTSYHLFRDLGNGMIGASRPM